MDAVAVRALCSSTGDERYVARVAPGIFADAFGVLRINFASRAGPVHWYGRFATDQRLGTERLLVLPEWLCLYHDLNTPLEATAELVRTVSICQTVKLARVFGQLPESSKARADLCTQLRGQVVFADAILPVMVWAQEEYYAVLSVTPQEEEDGDARVASNATTTTGISPSGGAAVFLIGRETEISFERADEPLCLDQPDCDIQELVERIRTHLLYCGVASKCVRQDGYAAGVCSNFVVLGGLDWHDAQSIQAMLKGQHSWAVHNLPLTLLVGDVEVEGREGDSIKRQKNFQTVLQELTARQERIVLWLTGLEFLNPTTLTSLTEILGEARISRDGSVCVIAPVLAEGAATRIHRAFYGSALLEMRSPRQGLSRQELFEHMYNVEETGMAIETSLSLVREAARFARGELVGEVMKRGLGAWDHIYGYEPVKHRLRFLVELGLFSNAPARRLGIEPVRGVLLHGPSGCGKSELIKALASDLSVPIIHVRPTRILSKYLGESEASLRALFAKARKSAPCVLFIDNMEVLGARRNLGDDGTGVKERLLSTLLNEMDGVTESLGVLVLGCTNQRELLDDALLRPGRLDHLLEVGLPDRDDRQEIIRRICARIHVQLAGDDPEGSLKHLCTYFDGRSGADIINCLMSFAFERLDQPLPLQYADLAAFLPMKP